MREGYQAISEKTQKNDRAGIKRLARGVGRKRKSGITSKMR